MSVFDPVKRLILATWIDPLASALPAELAHLRTRQPARNNPDITLTDPVMTQNGPAYWWSCSTWLIHSRSCCDRWTSPRNCVTGMRTPSLPSRNWWKL